MRENKKNATGKKQEKTKSKQKARLWPGLRRGSRVSLNADKDLPDMTRLEKKDFLQHDIIERMIRIEQAVAKNITGKTLAHHETDFYKELEKHEKMAFNRYLNSKKKKNIGKLLVLAIPLLAFGLMRFNMTGNVIRDSTGAEPYWWGWVALGVFIVLGIFMLAIHMLKRHSNRKLRRHEKDIVRRLSKR